MEKNINLLVIDDNYNITNNIKQYFSSHGSIKVVNTCNNGKEALDYILNFPDKFDMILMDILIPGMDGLELLEKIKFNGVNKKIIVLSSYKKEYSVKKVSAYNVGYYMLKPFSMESLEKRIIDLSKEDIETEDENDNVTLAVSNLLHSLGMPSHIKGYQYIRESIMMMYENPSMVGGITKEIYPEIADKFDTTTSRVERAIRHAIEVSWNRGDYDLMEEIFGNSVDYDRAKPTNSEFIATIADKLRVDKKLIMA
jgi:two-component system response regulator (stage 0 sporulation protein A)